ncbi:tetratricopeptide repeat protein [bacterium]|nr:tetratricopeptide repeat protein [bacterium]
MNSVEGTDTGQKFERMHQLALTMYRSKDLSAALKIWRRIKEKKPDFPDIDKWISHASKPPYPPTATKPQTDPTVFRTQRELISQFGNSSRRRPFRPKSLSTPMKPRLRHRNFVYVFLVLLLLYTVVSFRNNRAYMVQLIPNTTHLTCYQGVFFPLGWQKTMELEIGIENNWTQMFTDKKLINRLKHGISVHSLKEFDKLVIDVYMALGDESVKQMTIRSQQSAIYYFKKIESSDFRSLVSTKIAMAFINLADMKADDGDLDDAREYYQTARKYDHTHPALFELSERLKVSTNKSSTTKKSFRRQNPVIRIQ